MPIILTGSNSTFIADNLVPLLIKVDVECEMLEYEVKRPEIRDLHIIITLILVFEGPVSTLLSTNKKV